VLAHRARSAAANAHAAVAVHAAGHVGPHGAQCREGREMRMYTYICTRKDSKVEVGFTVL
jgi:hypothetical protein